VPRLLAAAFGSKLDTLFIDSICAKTEAALSP
jgi:hypothetical protein